MSNKEITLSFIHGKVRNLYYIKKQLNKKNAIRRTVMKKVIKTNLAPSAIGPYSQAIIAGSFLFISGQGAIDPDTQEYRPLSIKEETILALQNLKGIVESAGSTMENVVKTTIFLQDMNDFNEFNEAYSSFFPSLPPARSTIQAAKLPKGFKVEIEAIVLIS